MKISEMIKKLIDIAIYDGEDFEFKIYDEFTGEEREFIIDDKFYESGVVVLKVSD